MCGIYGWLGQSNHDSTRLMQCADQLLIHRGPDDGQAVEAPNWGLGFRRLAILDRTPSGQQPMSTPDGRYCMVFNGEVYNYIELREQMERAGESFVSGSDTEVVLRLLTRLGVAALSKLNGMFALALVDTHQNRFLLARDRLGVKPFYYRALPGQLVFASELKALLPASPATPVVDDVALVEYLAFGYLSSERCIFRGHSKLGPGQYMQGDLGTPHLAKGVRYWSVRIADDSRSPRRGGVDGESHAEELHDLLSDAVRIRLRSDVPVGLFLSGGLDSGVVAALAATAARAGSNSPPLALTMGFRQARYDETQLAASTAARVGLPHRTLVLEPAALAQVDRLAWFYDEPFGDASAMPMFSLCEAASEHATVFLSGDGGDEALAGYRRYLEARKYRLLGRLPAPVARGIRGLAGLLSAESGLRYRMVKATAPDAGYAAAYDEMPEDPALSMVLPGGLQTALPGVVEELADRWALTRGQHLTARQQALDYSWYLPDDILVKVDRASMAHSLEVRSPFLDYRLVEWAGRLPRGELLGRGVGKVPLRTLGRRLLPPEVLQAPKQGFEVPLDAWLAAPEGQLFARDRLLGEAAAHLGHWNTSGVRALLDAQAAGGRRRFGVLLWRLLMLQAWGHQYLGDDVSDKNVRPAPAGATSGLGAGE